MAGTAKNYSTTTVELGPGDIWLNVELPGAGARLTLATDLTPDSTASPSAIHLGMTTEGSKYIYKPSMTNFESDEQTAPVLSSITAEEARIEGSMLQVADMAILAKLIAGGTRATASGYDQIKFGGLQTLATYTVALIAPLQSDNTKAIVVQLYKAYNEAGFQLDISRKRIAASPFNFVGLSISSRAAGDQVGAYWKQV